MRKTLCILLVVAALPGGFWLGFKMNFLRGPNDQDVLREANQFQGLVESVMSYVRSHDGEIPADPYGGLVASGSVKHFDDFIIGDTLVQFDIDDIPPRINVDLSKNVQAPLFYLYPKGLREVWACFANGTWERIPLKFTFLELNSFAENQERWRNTFHDAGFPYWGYTIEIKEAWMKSEDGKVIWDEERRMYVPTNPKQSKSSRAVTTRGLGS